MAALAADMVPLYPKMLRYARRLTRNRHDAEDIAQSAFLRALTNAGQYREGSLSGWLLKLVHNQHIDEVRRARRRGTFVPLDLSLSVCATQEATVFCREALASIDRLEPGRRAVLALVPYQAGGRIDHREIAARLGIPTGTAASRLCRGRAELRAMAEA